uniref:IMD domain-containing protein n=1 Tax=Steinernema glaseri TaxID=37863 RepID=A0A1I7YV15_9BILA
MDQKVSELKERCSELKKKELALKEQIDRSERGKGFLKRTKGGDVFVLRRQLADVQNELAASVLAYKKEKKELHVCTMLKVRHAFKGMYDANHDLAVQSQVAFECLREIVEQVPAVSTQDVNRMNYQAKPITKELVDQLKANLSSSAQRTVRRRSEPPRRQGPSSPPPPYTPTAPPETVQRSHVSDSYLLRGDRTSNLHPEAETTPIRAPPRNDSSHVRSSRLYPDLPPNPYAVQRNTVVA